MQKIATPPTLSPLLLNTFFKKAAEFYQIAPWEEFGDHEYFGVQIPETKELHFVSIMGGGGQCFGIGSYRGIMGLMFLQDILAGENIADPFETRLQQDGLLLEFTTKKYLDEDDLALVKEFNYKPTTSKAWPLVRDLKPGYVSWYPQDHDLNALNRIMSATIALLDLSAENPECLFNGGAKKVPIFVLNKKINTWKLEYWGKNKIQSASLALEERYTLPPVDELVLQRAKKLSTNPKFNLELHDFYMREPVLEKERPFYPRVCAVLDKKSGACLGMELVSPEKDISAVFRDIILNKMVEAGSLPASIMVTKPEHFIGTITIEKALGIEIKFGSPQVGFEFEDGVRGHMEGRIQEP